jgi:hypothetical protein
MIIGMMTRNWSISRFYYESDEDHMLYVFDINQNKWGQSISSSIYSFILFAYLAPADQPKNA